MKRANAFSWVRVAALCGLLASPLALWAWHHLRSVPIDIVVATPEYRDIANLVTTNGMVEPVAQFQARANFPGMVGQVAVQLGDKVSVGQMLVTMKDPFAEARVATAASSVAGMTEALDNVRNQGTQEQRIAEAGDLEHAKAAQDDAQHALDALTALEQRGAASASEVAAARKRLNDANISLATLQKRMSDRFGGLTLHAAQVRLADSSAALTAAKISYGNANIASPIEGTVYSVSVSPYDYVPMGADLVRVADLNKMEVRAYFDEPEVGKLKEGQEVTVTWEGLPGRVWHGRIRRAPVAAMQQGNRSVAECLIQMRDTRGDLLPNTHVVVSVPLESRKHVMTIPRWALQANGMGNWVYRVEGEKLVRTPVTTGLINLDRAEITHGLSEQDVIAVRAVDEEALNDHMRVRPYR